MSNYLTYYVCAGIEEGKVSNDLHVDMCKLSIESLRKEGNYEDEILVITDRPDEFPTVDYTITLSPDDCTSIYDIGFYKFQVRKEINAENYDSILYLDNDNLIVNDIYPLLKLPDETITISEEFPINMLSSNIPFLTSEEKEEFENHPRINTGVFCIDADIFNNITENIETFFLDCVEKYDYSGVEQKPTNVMAIRGMIPYHPIPHNWVEFPLASKNVGPPIVVTDETKVMHFAGTVNHVVKDNEYGNNQLGHMRNVYDLIHDNDYREIQKQYSP